MTTPSAEEAVARLTELAKGPDIGLTDFVPHLRALLADHANQRALLVEAGEGLEPFAERVPLTKIMSVASDDEIVARAGIELGPFRQARTLRDKIRKAVGG
jgi:hypothetical protein